MALLLTLAGSSKPRHHNTIPRLLGVTVILLPYTLSHVILFSWRAKNADLSGLFFYGKNYLACEVSLWFV